MVGSCSAGTDWLRRERGQLILVESGLLMAFTPRAVHALPPGTLLWTPAATPHRRRVHGTFKGAPVEPPEHSDRDLPSQPLALQGTPLMHALVRTLSAHGSNGARLDRTAAWDVLWEEMARARSINSCFRWPVDPRVAPVVEAMVKTPEDDIDARAWAMRTRVSVRTLSRIFLNETGHSFAMWRRHVHVGHALMRLAEGASVSQVAEGLGFAHPSAFVASFRRVVGLPPGRCFSVPRA